MVKPAWALRSQKSAMVEKGPHRFVFQKMTYHKKPPPREQTHGPVFLMTP